MGNFSDIGEVGITAHAGGGRQLARQLGRQTSEISVVASEGDSVILPPAEKSMSFLLINNGANAMRVFASGIDTINGTDGATGILQPAGSVYDYTCFKITNGGAGCWASAGDSFNGGGGYQPDGVSIDANGEGGTLQVITSWVTNLIDSAIAALNLGTASTHAAEDFDAAGSASSAETNAIESANTFTNDNALLRVNNLGDLPNASVARTNLGLSMRILDRGTGVLDGSGNATIASEFVAASGGLISTPILITPIHTTMTPPSGVFYVGGDAVDGTSFTVHSWAGSTDAGNSFSWAILSS